MSLREIACKTISQNKTQIQMSLTYQGRLNSGQRSMSWPGIMTYWSDMPHWALNQPRDGQIAEQTLHTLRACTLMAVAPRTPACARAHLGGAAIVYTSAPSLGGAAIREGAVNRDNTVSHAKSLVLTRATLTGNFDRPSISLVAIGDRVTSFFQHW